MDDFKGTTGDYADTNRDGKVDFTEYDNECYDFEHIYKNGQSSGGYTPQKQSGFKGWLRNMTVTHWMLCNLIPNLIVNIVISVFLAIKKIIYTSFKVFCNKRKCLRIGLRCIRLPF